MTSGEFATHFAAIRGWICPSFVGRSKYWGGFIGLGAHAAACAESALANPSPLLCLPLVFSSFGGCLLRRSRALSRRLRVVHEAARTHGIQRGDFRMLHSNPRGSISAHRVPGKTAG